MDEQEVCQKWKGQALHPDEALFVHMKWETRNGEPQLCDADISQAAYVAVNACIRIQRSRLLAIGGTSNHIHAIFSFPASVSISVLAQNSMRTSSEAVARYLRFICGRSISAGAIWDCRCGLQTLSENDLPHVINYVQQQRTLHERGQTCEELERIIVPCEPRLTRNEVGLLRGKTGIPFSPN